MNFSNRIKKEMSEGVMRALLEDAGYRVVSSGIENMLREVCMLLEENYKRLGLPVAMRCLPDFSVTDKDLTEHHPVEVKYRTKWDKKVFEDLKKQILVLRAMVVVFIVGEPPKGKHAHNKPSQFLRCCRVRCDDQDHLVIEVTPASGQIEWVDPQSGAPEALWWQLAPLQTLFPKIATKRKEQTMTIAFDALRGDLGGRVG